MGGGHRQSFVAAISHRPPRNDSPGGTNDFLHWRRYCRSHRGAQSAGLPGPGSAGRQKRREIRARVGGGGADEGETCGGRSRRPHHGDPLPAGLPLHPSLRLVAVETSGRGPPPPMIRPNQDADQVTGNDHRQKKNRRNLVLIPLGNNPQQHLQGLKKTRKRCSPSSAGSHGRSLPTAAACDCSRRGRWTGKERGEERRRRIHHFIFN